MVVNEKEPQNNIFSEFGGDYIENGIPIIPVYEKRPAIRGWQNTKLEWFNWMKEKFPNANIGFLTGTPSGITIIDIDSRDYLLWAIGLFGDTCVKVESPRGFHLYYKFNGERKRLHYLGLPIDILGRNSLCLAPPSNTRKGSYRFIEGNLSDIPGLPHLKPIRRPNITVTKNAKKDLNDLCHDTSPALQFGVGARNNSLFVYACSIAYKCNDRGEIERRIRERNRLITAPLGDSEITRIIKSVCKRKEAGKLRLPGGEQWITFSKSEVENLPTEALQLLAHLKLCHSAKHGKEFTFANNTRNRMGISLHKFRIAKRALEELHLLKITHAGGNGPNDPPRAKLISDLTD